MCLEKPKIQGDLNKYFNPKKAKEPGLKDFEDDTIRIWSWNINGIRPVMSKNILQDFLKKYDPLILCLNETKIDESTLEKMHLKKNIPDDYVQVWNCCKPPIKGYAGTAIFSKVKPLKVIADLGVDEHDCEGKLTLSVLYKYINTLL